MRLWDFQKTAVDNVESLMSYRRPLVVSPGGSGKTVMIAELTRRLLARGLRRVLIISHRKEIVEQTLKTLAALGVGDVGVLTGTAIRALGAKVVVASIQSLRRRLWALDPVDAVIVDEAHHALARTYQDVTKYFSKAHHIGFTATPFRLDGRGLGDLYTNMVVAALPSQLIAEKHLAQPVLYRAPEEFMPDLVDLRIVAGDYVTSQLDERVKRTELVGNVVDNYAKRAKGKRAVAFAVSIEHSKSIAARFAAAGIAAEHLDGSMPTEERERVLGNFRDGRTHVVSNCLVLGEGYDLPSVEAVIMARPTNSLVLFIQQAARAMRYVPEKRPVLLDHGRLLEKFGLPEADREYVLTTTKANRRVWSSGPVKDCPGCGASIAFASRCCPGCGHEFLEMVRSIPEETPVTLVPYDMVEKARMAHKLTTFAAARGFPKAWAEKAVAVWSGYREKSI